MKSTRDDNNFCGLVLFIHNDLSKMQRLFLQNSFYIRLIWLQADAINANSPFAVNPVVRMSSAITEGAREDLRRFPGSGVGARREPRRNEEVTEMDSRNVLNRRIPSLDLLGFFRILSLSS